MSCGRVPEKGRAIEKGFPVTGSALLVGEGVGVVCGDSDLMLCVQMEMSNSRSGSGLAL